MFYKGVIKPLLFLIPAERAHYLGTFIWKLSMRIPGLKHLLIFLFSGPKDSKLHSNLLGLKFSNPIGLAAGFDKDGKNFDSIRHMGFGFVEVGTVTPRPQSGNPRPRLFRLPADSAVINRMGFNNDGVELLKQRLSQKNTDGIILGGNIGKNKDTPNSEAVEDYLACMRELHGLVDYFTINMSSPNTPNLRELQEKKPLSRILSKLQEFNQSQSAPKPILLKIAPDLSWSQLDDIVEIVKLQRLAGIVATNTTISREGLKTDKRQIEQIGNGGLSGAPLSEKSLSIVRYLRKNLDKDHVIVGVGGIMNPNAAKSMFEAGADLVQIYTGLIYEGPALVRQIKISLLEDQL